MEYITKQTKFLPHPSPTHILSAQNKLKHNVSLCLTLTFTNRVETTFADINIFAFNDKST